MQLTEERTKPARTGSGGDGPGVGDDPPGPRAGRGPGHGAARRPVTPPPAFGHLIAEAKAGCSLCFEHLYRQLAGQVVSYLRWHRASDPDGLTNDVFAQVHRRLGRFQGDEAGFRSWLFTIAHHRMIDDRRRSSRQPVTRADVGVDESLGWGDVEEDAFADMAGDQVRDLLAVLSPDQRDVVLLRVVADLSVEQVAQMLHKREGAIKALQHRALASLRRHLVGAAGTAG